MAEKYFDRHEAEELLPMIGDCLGQALEQKKKIDQLDEELSRGAARIMALGGSIPPLEQLARSRAERQKLASELEEAIKRIQETGCVIKDLEIGRASCRGRG